jgi:hypothetical protein
MDVVKKRESGELSLLMDCFCCRCSPPLVGEEEEEESPLLFLPGKVSGGEGGERARPASSFSVPFLWLRAMVMSHHPLAAAKCVVCGCGCVLWPGNGRRPFPILPEKAWVTVAR